MAQLVEQEKQTSPHLAHYLAEYRRSLEQGPPQPRWVAQARESAIAQFERLGFPTTKLEQWRFTSVEPIAERTFALATDGIAQAAPAGTAARAIRSRTPSASTAGSRRSCRRISTSCRRACRFSGSRRRSPRSRRCSNRTFAKLSLTQTSAFTSLNTAFLRDGIVVVIPARAVIEQPIEIIFASVSENGGSMSHPRLLIVAGEASQATVLERYVGQGAAFTNAVGEVWLGVNAVVDHYKLQEEAADAFHIASMFLHGARSGTFSSHSLTFGGGLVRNDVIAMLDGEGIDCTLNGLYVGRGTQLIDNHTTIDHAMPHCGSHEIYKGILADQSRAVFNGKIIVRPDAQKTDAKQTNKALLLSDDANINTKPELEIFANDVKCTHGAAIGQLDDEAMFYLRSRGLGVAESRAMLVRAFAGDILNRVKIEPVREYLEGILTARLPHVE